MSKDISKSIPGIYTEVQQMLEIKTELSKQIIYKKKNALIRLVYWIAAAFTISIPLTLLADEIIYILYPHFFVYALPEQSQWIWGIALFVICFTGMFMVRAGWLLHKWVIAKFF